MLILYNHRVLLLFLGGLFSLFLTIVVICAKQLHKRQIERKRLEGEKNIRPEEVGDITAKLDDSSDYKSPDAFEELTKWGIQPLLIISFVSLFDQNSELEICGAFFLVLWTLMHEFHFVEKFAKKAFYQCIILFFWLLFFGMISYHANRKSEGKLNVNNGNFTSSSGNDSTRLH